MNRYMIGNIVEFVKSCGNAFSYDMDDVTERLQEILVEYGIYSIFTDEEYYELLEELLSIAEKQEMAEAVRLAESQLKCGRDLEWGSDFRIPNYV